MRRGEEVLCIEVNYAAMNGDALREALRAIGRDEGLRRHFVRLAVEAEAGLSRPGRDVRETITGPLVDALYDGVDVVSVTLDDGTRFEVPYRSKIARDLVMRTVECPDHVFEPQTTKLLLQLARNARHAIIGGAYSGDHAVLLARRMAAHGGIVHAFEPNPEQMAYLRRNAGLNALTNLRFHELALWERSDVTLELVGDDAYARTAEAPAGRARNVAVTTIDEYAAAGELDRVDVIMLDVEGGELPILRGAQATIDAHGPAVVYEVNNAYVDWSRGLEHTVVAEFLAQRGYASYGIRDYQSNVDLRGYPVELVPADTAYLEGPRHGFNVLAIRDDAALAKLDVKLAPGLSPKLLRHRDPALHAPNR